MRELGRCTLHMYIGSGASEPSHGYADGGSPISGEKLLHAANPAAQQASGQQFYEK